MEKKEVSIKRYSQVLNEHKEEVYDIAIGAWQVPILHGLITPLADDPSMKGLTGRAAKDLIEQIRWWCRQKFREWGFTPEEVEYLDTRREETRKKEGPYTLTVNACESGALMGLILEEGELKRGPLSDVYHQLVDIKEGAVTKEVFPGGKLLITDSAGNIIIREPYPWEIASN